MRRAFTAAVVVLVALVLAGPASSTTPTEKKLQAQVKTLQKQVKTLQKQMATAQVLILGSIYYTGCTAAATADALQGTWAKVTPTSPFPSEPSVNDYNTCQNAFKISRQNNTATTLVLQSVIDFFLKH
ncbi:MAG: hypothetical protein WBB74_06930 [Gaiellaceae bacterium]